MVVIDNISAVTPSQLGMWRDQFVHSGLTEHNYVMTRLSMPCWLQEMRRIVSSRLKLREKVLVERRALWAHPEYEWEHALHCGWAANSTKLNQ